MHEIYVIVVYEMVVCIFNSQTGEMLEEQGLLDKFKYRHATLNYSTGNILLVAHNNNPTAKNQANTRIMQLKEIPA